MRLCGFVILLTCAAVACAATYTTYIGDEYQYQVAAMAADSAGNTYVTGNRLLQSAATRNVGPVTDVFICKLDPSGNLTVLGTFGGNNSDEANGIAVDSSGNIYVVGRAFSTNFPLVNPLQSTAAVGGPPGTGFLMKLAPDGTVIYATYLGGKLGGSALNAVAADAQGNAYVTGRTEAADYPHTPGLPQGPVSTSPVAEVDGAFFAKINPTGSQIVYAGAISAAPGCGALCQGAFVYNAGSAIALDPAGNAYIAGNGAAGLPTTASALATQGIGAFVAKVNAAGTGMVYVTYLGAGGVEPAVGISPTDSVGAIAADAAGNAYISGVTSDPQFPATAGAYLSTPPTSGNPEAFAAKLNPAGSAIIWATLLGSVETGANPALGLSSTGDVWLSGATQSVSFPTTASVNPGGYEFVAELNSSGSSLLYSALFPQNTVAQAIAVDPAGTVHAAGDTGLLCAFPASAPPGQTSAPWLFGITNAAVGPLVGRLAPGELISFFGLRIGPATPQIASAPAGLLPTTLGGVEVSINGFPAPLLYTSATQINAIAPVELEAGSPAEIQVTVNGTPLADFRGWVDLADPGVFTSPYGGAAAINQDGTLNTQSNPAPDGSYVSIWVTGTGYFPGSDGQIATAADPICGAQFPVCGVFENGGLIGATNTPLNVMYSGAAPGIVNGVVQINFQVSSSAQFGYYLSVNGIDSTVFGIFTSPN